MSLALLEGYSSAEEEKEEGYSSSSLSDDGDEEEGGRYIVSRKRYKKPSFNLSEPSSNSLLPSAFDAFSEVAGPPEFLNNSVAAVEPRDAPREFHRRGRNKSKREKKDLPAGVVVEAKAQLVGIRDRVRSDIDGPTPSFANTTPAEGKRLISASNPEAEDAAELLRMCLHCEIPKTYSHAKGMVCPACGDRPPVGPKNEPEKKKGSAIKDKEKSKRMKGQSSHASWKSETEMQLRQQFD